MRRLPYLLLLLAPAACFAQQGNTVSITGSGAPTGSCSYIFRYIDSSAGTEYNCKAGAWNSVGGGGGGGAAFSAITAGTNSTAAMVVGTGASLATSGSGTIAATSVAGGPTYSTVSTPATPTLATIGSAGSTTITYGIVGCQDTTCTYHTPVSATASIATANGTLTSSNAVVLSGYQTYGSLCYNVYRLSTNGTAPTTVGKIASCVGLQYKDGGAAGDAGTAPSTNTTVLVSNPWPLPGAAIAIGQAAGVDAPQATPTATDEECSETSGFPDQRWTAIGASFTATTAGGYCTFTDSTAANTLKGETLTLPATPWTYVARVCSVGTSTSGNSGMLFGLSDGTKYEVIRAGNGANGTDVDKWTNSSTYASSPFASGNSGPPVYCGYYQLIGDGTNVTFKASSDGTTFVQLFTEVKGAFFTTAPTNLFIGVIDGSGTAISSFKWIRRTQ